MRELDRADPAGAIAAAAKRCSNWGRWGADDVHGTLNFLDDTKRRSGAALVRRRDVGLRRPRGRLHR